ncbi:hypothetical protein JGU66_16285 [Myxococcaceae bacterium JPH2]|nr:hypothetical protein [Myxococcaceae bacterium JPH2]
MFGLALCLGVAAGCLVPQDSASFLDSLPVMLNRPPRIIENQVRPPERLIRDFGATTCALDFSVEVQDPDVDDTLSVEWYVDYPTDGRIQQVDEFTNTGRPDRAGGAQLHVDLRAANSLLASPGLHVVEAIVTDTRLIHREPRPRGQLDLADGGTVVNPGFATSYAWVVNTVQGNCR